MTNSADKDSTFLGVSSLVKVECKLKPVRLSLAIIFDQTRPPRNVLSLSALFSPFRDSFGHLVPSILHRQRETILSIITSLNI